MFENGEVLSKKQKH